ncbi:unnamed protein product [Schistosoma margrebowiei]|uniref:Uncharacterized protein n=1 Tax=Schistosoma margrebowiei TaxID=48269 RepID=A0A183LPE7_9TREM|nr:unnamed protein product [Schistosoma margrebowiei]
MKTLKINSTIGCSQSSEVPNKGPDILMGDFNAKVGTDNTGYEDIMGRHRLGERKENGKRFANLCVVNKLVIRIEF